jgi:hypothetical protein
MHPPSRKALALFLSCQPIFWMGNVAYITAKK